MIPSPTAAARIAPIPSPREGEIRALGGRRHALRRVPLPGRNQFLFASDWMTYVDEDLNGILGKPLPLPMPGSVVAQVVGTGLRSAIRPCPRCLNP